jgi:hypothetical protein
MLLNKLRGAVINAGETQAMVPAEVLVASLGPSPFITVSGEDM